MALILYPLDGYDTFCSLADAESLITNNIPSIQHTAWDALQDPEKEILLRQATLIIKNKIDLPEELENELKLATVYLANSSVGLDMTNDDGKSNIKSKEIVGVVKTEFFGKSSDSNSLPDMVTMLLSKYDFTSGSSFIFQRA